MRDYIVTLGIAQLDDPRETEVGSWWKEEFAVQAENEKAARTSAQMKASASYSHVFHTWVVRVESV